MIQAPISSCTCTLVVMAAAANVKPTAAGNSEFAFTLLLTLPYCIEGSRVLDSWLQCRDTIKMTFYYLK